MEIQKPSTQTGLANQLAILPPFRPVHARVGPVNGLEAVHVVRRPPDASALWEEHGRGTVRPASPGEESGAGGEADVDGELWV